MAEKEFAYAVARIRCKEMTVLDRAFLEQLVGAKAEDDCLRLVVEKGWEPRRRKCWTPRRKRPGR